MITATDLARSFGHRIGSIQVCGAIAPNAIMEHPPCLSHCSPVIKSRYHPVGLLAAICIEKKFIENSAHISIAIEPRWQKVIETWLDDPSIPCAHYKKSLRELLQSFSCRLSGQAVDDWIKRILPWDEVFKQLGVDDDAFCHLLAEAIKSVLKPDAHEVRLEVLMITTPGMLSSSALKIYSGFLTSTIAQRAGVSGEHLLTIMQADESGLGNGSILFAVPSGGTFPTAIAGKEAGPLSIGLTAGTAGSQGVDFAFYDLNLEGSLKIFGESIWRAALSDWSTSAKPERPEECLKLIEGIVLEGGRYLQKGTETDWMNILVELAEDTDTGHILRTISTWIKDFRTKRYEKRPLVEIPFRYQLSLLLHDQFSDKQLEDLWPVARTLDRLPPGMYKVLIEALGKDRLPFSFVNSLLQIAGIVCIALSDSKEAIPVQLDFTSGRYAVRIDCDGNGTILIPIDFFSILKMPQDCFGKSREEANRLLVGLLQYLGPKSRTADQEMAVYLQSLGLDAEQLKTLAFSLTQSSQPERCAFGLLLYEVVYALLPDTVRGSDLLDALPSAFSHYKGKERTHFLPGVRNIFLGAPSFEYLLSTVEEMCASPQQAQSLWIRGLFQSEDCAYKQKAFALWKAKDDPQGSLGRVLIGLAKGDFSLKVRILLKLKTRLDLQEQDTLTRLVLGQRPRPCLHEAQEAFRTLLCKGSDLVVRQVKYMDMKAFLELLEYTPDGLERLKHLVAYADAKPQELSSLSYLWLSALNRALEANLHAEVWNLLMNAQARQVAFHRVFKNHSAAQSFVTQILTVLPSELSLKDAEAIIQLGTTFDLQTIHGQIESTLYQYLKNLFNKKRDLEVLKTAFDTCIGFLSPMQKNELSALYVRACIQAKNASFATDYFIKWLAHKTVNMELVKALAPDIVQLQIESKKITSAIAIVTHDKLPRLFSIETFDQIAQLEMKCEKPRPILLEKLVSYWLTFPEGMNLIRAVSIADMVMNYWRRWPFKPTELETVLSTLREGGDAENAFTLLSTCMSNTKVTQEEAIRCIQSVADTAETDQIEKMAQCMTITETSVVGILARRYLSDGSLKKAEEWMHKCPQGAMEQLQLTLAAAYRRKGNLTDCSRVLRTLSNEAATQELQSLLTEEKLTAQEVAEILLYKDPFIISGKFLERCVQGLLTSKGKIPWPLLTSLLERYSISNLTHWVKIFEQLNITQKVKYVDRLFQSFFHPEPLKWADKPPELQATFWSIVLPVLQKAQSQHLLALIEANFQQRFISLFPKPDAMMMRGLLSLFVGAVDIALIKSDLDQRQKYLLMIYEGFLDMQKKWSMGEPLFLQMISSTLMTLFFSHDFTFLFPKIWVEAKSLLQPLDSSYQTLPRHVILEWRQRQNQLVWTMAQATLDQESVLDLEQLLSKIHAQKGFTKQSYFQNKCLFALIKKLLSFNQENCNERAGHQLLICLNSSAPLDKSLCLETFARLKKMNENSSKKILWSILICDRTEEFTVQNEELFTGLINLLDKFTKNGNMREAKCLIETTFKKPSFIKYLIRHGTDLFWQYVCLVDESAIKDDSDATLINGSELTLIALFFKKAKEQVPSMLLSFYDCNSLYKENNNKQMSVDFSVLIQITRVVLSHTWGLPRFGRLVQATFAEPLITFTGSFYILKLPQETVRSVIGLLPYAWVTLKLSKRSDVVYNFEVENQCNSLAERLQNKYLAWTGDPEDRLPHLDYRAAALCVGVIRQEDICLNEEAQLVARALEFLISYYHPTKFLRAVEMLKAFVFRYTQKDGVVGIIEKLVQHFIGSSALNPHARIDKKTLLWQAYLIVKAFHFRAKEQSDPCAHEVIRRTILTLLTGYIIYIDDHWELDKVKPIVQEFASVLLAVSNREGEGFMLEREDFLTVLRMYFNKIHNSFPDVPLLDSDLNDRLLKELSADTSPSSG